MGAAAAAPPVPPGERLRPSEPAPPSEPAKEPVPAAASAPEVRHEPVPERTAEPAPERAAEAEQTPEPARPEALPDFVVVPGTRPDPPPPPPEPEPEPDLDLEPLPDYIVDPSRPAPEKPVEPERRQAAEAAPTTFPGLIPHTPAPEPPGEPSGADAAGIYFPPVTSFPVPRDDNGDGDAPREPRKTTRRRPPAQTPSKARRSTEEPGDDAGDPDWMAGLSNRLSAYSLAEEGQEGEPEPGEEQELEDDGS